MHYDNNPYKVEDGEYLRNHETSWNFDARNENYYLGKINEDGETDLKMSYFSDGKTSRYYRKGELINNSENVVVAEPFRNNSYEGKRKRNFSFKLPGSRRKKEG